MKVILADKYPATQDIAIFEFVSADGAPLPAFDAGAHIDVKIADHLMRPYSLCNAPGETHRYRIAVLRDPASRGGSLAMHGLMPGARVEIGAPRNLFALAPDATHSVLIAGGIGITPLLAMAQHLAARGAPFALHYSTRSPAHAAFADRLAAPDLRAHTRLYHDSDPARRIDLARIVAAPAPGKHLYVCGPASFIEAALARAQAAGWRDDHLHREYFAAPPFTAPPQSFATQSQPFAAQPQPQPTAASAPPAPDGAFQVRLHRSGQTLDVPADQTIVQALAARGIEIPTACEQGICGTCLTRVIAGEPDHRDHYLTDMERAANDRLLPCCSRARSRVIVLDV